MLCGNELGSIFERSGAFMHLDDFTSVAGVGARTAAARPRHLRAGAGGKIEYKGDDNKRSKIHVTPLGPKRQ
jgi:hypothetical protein